MYHLNTQSSALLDPLDMVSGGLGRCSGGCARRLFCCGVVMAIFRNQGAQHWKREGDWTLSAKESEQKDEGYGNLGIHERMMGARYITLACCVALLTDANVPNNLQLMVVVASCPIILSDVNLLANNVYICINP